MCLAFEDPLDHSNNHGNIKLSTRFDHEHKSMADITLTSTEISCQEVPSLTSPIRTPTHLNPCRRTRYCFCVTIRASVRYPQAQQMITALTDGCHDMNKDMTTDEYMAQPVACEEVALAQPKTLRIADR